MPGTTTAVSMAKGGVGRTTIAVNLAERLSARELDVLLVDLTRGGDATAYLDEAGAGVRQVLVEGVPLEDAVVERDDLDLLPTGPRPEGLVEALRDDELAVSERIVGPASENYDHVIVDTPSVIGPLSDAALVAADAVLLPVGASEADLDALERTIDDGIAPVRSAVSLSIAGIVPSRVHGDEDELELLEELRASALGDLVVAIEPGIREGPAFREARREHEPVARHDPTSEAVDSLDAVADAVDGGGVRV